MRALIQRVSQANVKIDEKIISEIKQGLLVLVCAMADDTEIEAEQMASKISKIRIFNDENGKMNKSIKDINGEALVVSQFTLAADTSRGPRAALCSPPSSMSAATRTGSHRRPRAHGSRRFVGRLRRSPGGAS